RGQAPRHVPPLRLLPPPRSLRPAASPPSRRPGPPGPPPSPPRLQGQDRLRPRRHHDHGRPASPRGRHRESRPLHGKPRRFALASPPPLIRLRSSPPPSPPQAPSPCPLPLRGRGMRTAHHKPGGVGGCPPGTRIFWG